MAIKMPSPEDQRKAAQQQQIEQVKRQVAAIQEEIEQGKDDAETWYNLGVGLLNLNEYVDAKKAFLNALQHDEQMIHAWTNLGVAHFELGEFQQASATSKRALKIRAGFLPARLNLGMSSLMLGRFKEASDAFELVLKQEPEMPAALAGMTRALEGLGRKTDAIDYKRRAERAGVRFE